VSENLTIPTYLGGSCHGQNWNFIPYFDQLSPSQPSQEAFVCDYQSPNQAIDPHSSSRFSTALPGGITSMKPSGI
jgi:hypothetical protein